VFLDTRILLWWLSDDRKLFQARMRTCEPFLTTSVQSLQPCSGGLPPIIL
jgi:PIN domain nuclease of toxin-antitoxin system